MANRIIFGDPHIEQTLLESSQLDMDNTEAGLGGTGAGGSQVDISKNLIFSFFSP